ncbi:MAG: DUF1579 family protein [Kofleriaceae bacterium]
MERQEQGQGDTPATDPHTPRTPGPQRALLDMFVGTWRVEGENASQAPLEPGTRVTGLQTYEPIPGNFFLRGQWHRRFGDAEHTGTSLLGHDPDKGAFLAHHYDNLGYAREYVVDVRDRVWTFAGRYERATIVFDHDGEQFHETWELSKDGATWEPLCELHGTRGPSHEDLVRQAYGAWPAHDREALERVIGADFRFTSPYDDAIDRELFFARCWPNHEHMQALEIQRIARDGDALYVTYELVLDTGKHIHNTERVTFHGGRLASVQVFFGETRDPAGTFQPKPPG